MTYIVDGPGPDVFTTDEFDGKFTKHCSYDKNEVDLKYKQIMVLYEENKEIIIAHKYWYYADLFNLKIPGNLVSIHITHVKFLSNSRP